MKPLDTPDTDRNTLPPSARHVAHVLQEDGPLPAHELLRLTGIPRRTVYRSLDILRDEGILDERPDPSEPRTTVYELAD